MSDSDDDLLDMCVELRTPEPRKRRPPSARMAAAAAAEAISGEGGCAADGGKEEDSADAPSDVCAIALITPRKRSSPSISASRLEALLQRTAKRRKLEGDRDRLKVLRKKTDSPPRDSAGKDSDSDASAASDTLDSLSVAPTAWDSWRKPLPAVFYAHTAAAETPRCAWKGKDVPASLSALHGVVSGKHGARRLAKQALKELLPEDALMPRPVCSWLFDCILLAEEDAVALHAFLQLRDLLDVSPSHGFLLSMDATAEQLRSRERQPLTEWRPSALRFQHLLHHYFGWLPTGAAVPLDKKPCSDVEQLPRVARVQLAARLLASAAAVGLLAESGNDVELCTVIVSCLRIASADCAAQARHAVRCLLSHLLASLADWHAALSRLVDSCLSLTSASARLAAKLCMLLPVTARGQQLRRQLAAAALTEQLLPAAALGGGDDAVLMEGSAAAAASVLQKCIDAIPRKPKRADALVAVVETMDALLCPLSVEMKGHAAAEEAFGALLQAVKAADGRLVCRQDGAFMQLHDLLAFVDEKYAPLWGKAQLHLRRQRSLQGLLPQAGAAGE